MEESSVLDVKRELQEAAAAANEAAEMLSVGGKLVDGAASRWRELMRLARHSEELLAD